MTVITKGIAGRDEARVASPGWMLAVLVAAGFATLWLWLLRSPPLSAPPGVTFSLMLPLLATGGLWAWMVLCNCHRALLALWGSITPGLMVWLAAMELNSRGLLDGWLPDSELLTVAERQTVWIMTLSVVLMLVILAFSLRKGLGQAAARRAVLQERRQAREAEEQAKVDEKARQEQGEADRIAARKRRAALIEDATARVAERIAGGKPAAAGFAGRADDLAALALFQDIGRQEALGEEESQRRRADTAEAELEKSREQIRKLKQRLRVKAVSDMTVGLVADMAERTLPGAALGGLYAGNRVGNAFDRIRG